MTPELVYPNGCGASDGAMRVPPMLCSTVRREALCAMVGVAHLTRVEF